MSGSIPAGRPAKGPRLFLKPASPDRAALWYIRDGSQRRSTGCSPDDRAGAEQALAAYIAQKHSPRQRQRRADEALIADILNLYLTDKAPDQKRPQEAAGRAVRLLEFWGDKTVADIQGSTCRAYVAQRDGIYAARRELEDLRAAINYALHEGQIDRAPPVTLPPKPSPRQDWLTPDDAAQLIWSAWRHVEIQKGQRTRKHTRRHIARFALVALYTGTRSGAICSASFEREPGRGFVDLEKGYFHRRPDGEIETKKRKPPIRIPARLLAHMRRWHGNGQRYVVEFQGNPVETVKRVFPKVVADAGLPSSITAHSLRHTAATWAMQNGTEPWLAADYLGMSIETLTTVYGHHHPDLSAQAGEIIARRPRSKSAPASYGAETGQKPPSKHAEIVK